MKNLNINYMLERIMLKFFLVIALLVANFIISAMDEKNNNKTCIAKEFF